MCLNRLIGYAGGVAEAFHSYAIMYRIIAKCSDSGMTRRVSDNVIGVVVVYPVCAEAKIPQ